MKKIIILITYASSFFLIIVSVLQSLESFKAVSQIIYTNQNLQTFFNPSTGELTIQNLYQNEPIIKIAPYQDFLIKENSSESLNYFYTKNRRLNLLTQIASLFNKDLIWYQSKNGVDYQYQVTNVDNRLSIKRILNNRINNNLRIGSAILICENCILTDSRQTTSYYNKYLSPSLLKADQLGFTNKKQSNSLILEKNESLKVTDITSGQTISLYSPSRTTVNLHDNLRIIVFEQEVNVDNNNSISSIQVISL